MSMLKVENLSVHYGMIQAVRDVSFEVNEGEVVSLIGANGAGKTSILRTISGLVRPSAGKIEFLGQEIQKAVSYTHLDVYKRQRFMLPNAEYMIHQPMGGTGGGTQQTDMAIAAEHLLKTRNNLEKILADNSGQSIEKVHADAERDNWMSAQETLEYGFIDEIMANNKLG